MFNIFKFNEDFKITIGFDKSWSFVDIFSKTDINSEAIELLAIGYIAHFFIVNKNADVNLIVKNHLRNSLETNFSNVDHYDEGFSYHGDFFNEIFVQLTKREQKAVRYFFSNVELSTSINEYSLSALEKKHNMIFERSCTHKNYEFKMMEKKGKLFFNFNPTAGKLLILYPLSVSIVAAECYKWIDKEGKNQFIQAMKILLSKKQEEFQIRNESDLNRSIVYQ